MTQDQYADLLFPVEGLDLYQSFMRQREGTTPVGKNVRAYEPGTQRARGGARPGLLKWIPPQLPSGSHLIQHLNYIVDPTPGAIDDVSLDPTLFDTVDDPTTNPPGSDPTNLNDHTVRIRPPRHVRRGGWGHRPNRNTNRKKSIAFIQAATLSAAGGGPNQSAAIVYSSNVTAGNLLLCGAFSFPAGTVTVTDSMGNAWTRIGSISTGDASPVTASLWAATAGSSGANTVTVTNASTPGFVQAGGCVLEYSGTSPAGQDSTATNTVTSPGSGVMTTGTISVGGSGELAIGLFCSNFGGGGTSIGAGAGFTRRSSATSVILFVEDDLGVSASLGLTATRSPGPTFSSYAAVGASFKPS